MSGAEEALAADLGRAGGDAWERLQESVSSNLTVDWDGGVARGGSVDWTKEKKKSETKTVNELRAMAFDPNRETRERAFRAELAAWKSVELPIAAALNGVKGFSVILNRRRHYASNLEEARRAARVSEKTLSALTGAMEDSLPQFRSYLKTKARLLGLPKLAFFDLFAPVGGSSKRWTFDEARAFIIEQFTSFSWDLGEFAEQAFNGSWIDAEMRRGKVGGAYCTSLPLAKESRILANFDGSFSSVTTLAHELGHGYHHHVLKDASAIHRDYPMTLAETASIFCEAVVFSKALETFPEEEKLSVLETFLQDSTQVIVDILSRYKFESMLFEARKSAEVSPEELCSFMEEAQKQTYGDGLDSENLHPYMWAVKPHYYRTGLAFYNFPYSFGQLFGLGLYAQYQQQPNSFPERYRALLELTGRAGAEKVTREAGFDIETKDFWKSGLDTIGNRIAEFTDLVSAQGSSAADG
jgi:pepF/M3 family oligoendopeptidase